jgi:hypothetical protein
MDGRMGGRQYQRGDSMTRNPWPSDVQMVHNILTVYERATADDKLAGRDWYPTAGRIVDSIAQSAAMPAHRVAFALAALSPRNPWRWNVADAYRYAHAAASVLSGAPDDGPPPATTFGDNRTKAWRVLVAEDYDVYRSAAPKVRAFMAAVTGNPLSVVVDVWATLVATNGERDTPGRQYQPIADAYARAARISDETPAALQAITWIVAQREGLGSRRVARHDVTYKAGTPDAVRAMMEGA